MYSRTDLEDLARHLLLKGEITFSGVIRGSLFHEALLHTRINIDRTFYIGNVPYEAYLFSALFDPFERLPILIGVCKNETYLEVLRWRLTKGI